MVCGICKESGHSKRTCTNKPAIQSNGSTEPNKGKSKVIENGSTRNFSTLSAKVKEVEQTLPFAKEMQDEILDLKEILSQRLPRKLKKIVNILDEKETRPKLSETEAVEKKESKTSESSTKQRLKKPDIGIHWLNSEALQRLYSGPTPEDGPGHIYMYRISDPTTEERNGKEESYKIGLSKHLPARRIHAQEIANKQSYKPVITRETPYRYLTETVIHRQLKSQRTPRSYGDGRTEWFTGDKEEFKETITKVIREVNALYSD